MSALRQDEAPGAGGRSRLHVDDPRYWDLCEFLWDEAELLDSGRLVLWHGLFTADVRYQVPVRVNAPNGEAEFSKTMFHLDETNLTLGVKTQRIVSTSSAWAESPPSRTRRTVSGVRVYAPDDGDEYAVTSSFILLRYRYDHPIPDFVSGQRWDRIRHFDDTWKIARRTVLLDQTTLGTPNLAIFL